MRPVAKKVDSWRQAWCFNVEKTTLYAQHSVIKQMHSPKKIKEINDSVKWVSVRGNLSSCRKRKSCPKWRLESHCEFWREIQRPVWVKAIVCWHNFLCCLDIPFICKPIHSYSPLHIVVSYLSYMFKFLWCTIYWLSMESWFFLFNLYYTCLFRI